MKPPNLKDLQNKFEEIKDDQYYMRLRFFRRMFEIIYPKNHFIHDKLIAEGSPNRVVMHPSLAKKMIENTSIEKFCSVQKHPFLKENKLVFIWNIDGMDKNHNVDAYILNNSKNNKA